VVDSITSLIYDHTRRPARLKDGRSAVVPSTLSPSPSRPAPSSAWTPSPSSVTAWWCAGRFPERVALLMVREVRSGKLLARPVEVATGGGGSFRARLRVDQAGWRGVEVTPWRRAGTTAIPTARDLVDSPCVAGTSRSRAAVGTLPRTGGSAPALVSLGFGLIALGAIVRHAGRRPPGRARGGTHLAGRATRGRHERT